MKKLTRSKKQLIIALTAGVLIMAAGTGIAYVLNIRQMNHEFNARISVMEDEIIENQKTVYKAVGEIKAGNILKEENLQLVVEYYSLDTSCIISADDIGKRALIDIKDNQPVLKNMLEPEFDSGLRELEYYLFKFNTNIVEDDFVDIRIRFSNGEDLIVLPKKLLKNVDLSTNKCNLWLTEEEILHLSSAIVDAAQYESAYLYTAKYLDSGQVKSEGNYQPNESVMLLIANDPNVVSTAVEKLNLKARKELEERLEKTKNSENEAKQEKNSVETNNTEEPEIYSAEEDVTYEE